MKGYVVLCSLSILGVLGVSCLSAQYQSSFGETGLVLPGGHRGGVNVLIDDERGHLLSAGSDGFLEVWNVNHAAAVERFQLSPYPITAMVLRPGKPHISLIESDGTGLYRISAWDYEAKKKLFTLSFKNTLSAINYSGGGNFLMVLQSGRPTVLFVHAETGELLPAPDITGRVSFAATGKSERTMITYLPTGVLSYWDLESKQEIQHVTVPPQIQSPLLLGNNRFLGGIDSEGLLILNAVSGATLIRERFISQGILLSLGQESSEFMCLVMDAYTSTLYHFNISNAGKLETKKYWGIPRTIPSITSATLTADTLAFGTFNGNVWLGRQDGSSQMMQVRNQQRILEAAASGSTLAFLTQNHTLGFIPLDYTRINDTQSIGFEEVPYTHITAGQELHEGLEQFILWQDNNIRSFPMIRTLQGGTSLDSFEGDPYGSRWSDTLLNKLTLRAPLRSTAILGEKVLFLDSLGNITVLSVKTGGVLFSFSSMASLDAVFLNERNILIGRSVISGNTPFLMVNIITGETVPLAYPAAVALRVYRGPSGTPYGVLIEQQTGTLKTAVIRLNTTNPSLSTKLFEEEGEDTGFSMMESKEGIVSTLGGQGAWIYGSKDNSFLERSPGLPRRLIDGGAYVIALDTEGNIAWYDPQSRNLLALFHLYEDAWILQKGEREVLGGRVLENKPAHVP